MIYFLQYVIAYLVIGFLMAVLTILLTPKLVTRRTMLVLPLKNSIGWMPAFLIEAYCRNYNMRMFVPFFIMVSLIALEICRGLIFGG